MNGQVSEIDRLYQILQTNMKRRFCPLWDLDSHQTDLGGSGIYFFFERGELRADHCRERITRIGIAEKQDLFARLDCHRKTIAVSAFVTLVYSALARYYNLEHILRSKLNTPLLQVDRYLNQNFASIPDPPQTQMRAFERTIVIPYMTMLRVTWVQVRDLGLLRDIERQAIALLSNYSRGAAAIDPPSRGWLGRYSDNSRVRISGLWNDRFVTRLPPNSYDWLDSLEKLV